MKTRDELSREIQRIIEATPTGTADPLTLATLITNAFFGDFGAFDEGRSHTVLSLAPRAGGRPVRPRLLVNGVEARGLASARVRSQIGRGTTAKLVFTIAERGCLVEGFAGVVDDDPSQQEDWRRRARPKDWPGWSRE